ncbi:hypothetical protein HDV00_001734 [Rhizophlyctis rosea]|nr:hypothetical protein HDV00_001734 [Rhizophlyctis rosea]
MPVTIDIDPLLTQNPPPQIQITPAEPPPRTPFQKLRTLLLSHIPFLPKPHTTPSSPQAPSSDVKLIPLTSLDTTQTATSQFFLNHQASTLNHQASTLNPPSSPNPDTSQSASHYTTSSRRSSPYSGIVFPRSDAAHGGNLRRFCEELFLKKWKDFDEDMEKKYRSSVWKEYKVVVRTAGSLLLVHFLYACIVVRLTQEVAFFTPLILIILFGIYLPITIGMLWISFDGTPPDGLWKLFILVVNAFLFAYANVYAIFDCAVRHVGGMGRNECYETMNGSATLTSFLFYGLLGPLVMLFIYRLNRFCYLIFSLLLLSMYLYLISGVPSIGQPYTFGLFMIGFFLLCTLLSYWQERVERDNFKLRTALKAQVEATRVAQGGEIREAASKRRFVSYIFHEIRVPFNTAVLGFHNMDGDGVFANLNGGQQQVLEAIKSSFGMMESVLNDVLDFQKMEEGKFELQARPFDINSTLRSVAKSLASTAREKNIAIETVEDGRVDMWGGRRLVGDDIRYRQVLNNFLSNALKFTPRNGTIQILTQLTEVGNTKVPDPPSSRQSQSQSHIVDLDAVTLSGEPGSTVSELTHAMPSSITVRTSVKDSGVGISKEDIKRMFQPYTQINSWANQGGKGTGLGLAICKHIVQLAGGTCGVESSEGQGSTFWFEITFPVSSAPSPPHPTSQLTSSTNICTGIGVRKESFGGGAASATSPPISSSSDGSGGAKREVKHHHRSLNVLVVDDDGITRKMMGRMLEQMGHSCLWAEDGVEAVEIVTGRGVEGFVEGSGTGDGGVVSVDRGGGDVGGGGRLAPSTTIPISLTVPKMALTPSTSSSTSSSSSSAPTSPTTPLPLLSSTIPAPTPASGTTPQHFDVILMDNQMPRMTGEECVAELRRRGVVTPVVGITGNALKEDQESFMRAGANLVITKPLAKGKLVGALRLIP